MSPGPTWVDAGMQAGQPLTINGDGSLSRDFTYVGNVVDANLWAIEAEGAGEEVFNVACGASITLNEIVERLRQLLGVEGDIHYGLARIGDVPLSMADIGRARSKLGYEPVVSTWEGLESTV